MPPTKRTTMMVAMDGRIRTAKRPRSVNAREINNNLCDPVRRIIRSDNTMKGNSTIALMIPAMLITCLVAPKSDK